MSAPSGDPRFLSCGWIAPEIWAEVGARHLTFRQALDGSAPFDWHDLSTLPLRHGRRTNPEGCREGILIREKFDSALKSFEFHARNVGTTYLSVNRVCLHARR
jgi:hypothetical protein